MLNQKNAIRTIGAIEIFGGILGAKATTVSILTNKIELLTILAFYIPMLIFFCTSVVAGIFLLEEQTRGVKLSKYIQYIQVPVIGSPLISYFVINGLGLPIYLGGSSGFNFLIDVNWQIQIMSQNAYSVGFNLIPVLALYILYKAKSSQK